MKSKSYSGLFTANVTNEFYASGMLPSAETVNGQRLAIGYDNDQLPVQFGSLVLQRDTLSGLVTKKTVGTFSEDIEYSEFGEVKSKTVRNGTALVYQETYTRDRLSRITSRVQVEVASTKTWGYEYDDVGRLKRVSIDGAVVREYAYDGNGNRTQIIETTGTTSASFDAQDRMLTQGQFTYIYNDHGDRVQKNNTATGVNPTYNYTSLGQLRSVVSNLGSIEYKFDGDNRRIARSINGVVRSFYVYDSSARIVAELDQNSALRSRFVYLTQGHSPDYMHRAGRNYFFIKDHLGSILKVVDTVTGSVTQELQYDEYGKRLVDTNISFQPFGFAGGLFDGNTGLVRFGARDYDPETGRWTSKDPILLRGGDVNLFSYVGNNPTNFIDPSGLKVEFENEFYEETWNKTKANAPGCIQTFMKNLEMDQSRNVKISGAPPDGYRGFAAGDNGNYEIDIARDLIGTMEAQSTLAHELGHIDQMLRNVPPGPNKFLPEDTGLQFETRFRSFNGDVRNGR